MESATVKSRGPGSFVVIANHENGSLNEMNEGGQNGARNDIDTSGLSRIFDGYEKSIRPALDAVDEIRPCVKDIPDISAMLPALVVVGEQSAGKSSLLESISGIALPRGHGMCTKVPLELQLRKDKDESITMDYTNSAGVAVNKPNISFNDISEEIENATIDIVGSGKSIKDQPISLRICGPTMKDLTLIDLPGITRASNTVEAANVEHEVKEMITRYVESESKVIVCALPANVDFSNSGALKIAQDLDVDGKRTQGVVTKIDTYEKGTGIKDKIEGTHDAEIKLKLGYIAVRCRTQVELQAGMSLEELHALERNLLETDEELRHIRDNLKGTPTLINQLIKIQRDRLKERVPDLIMKIEEAIVDRNKELEGLKDLPETPEDCFLQLIMAANSVCGKYKEMSSQDVHQRMKMDIRHRIYLRLEQFKQEIVAASSNVFRDEIYARVKELCSVKRSSVLPNFLSISAFKEIFRREFLDSFVEPKASLIEEVHTLTTDALHSVIEKSLGTKLEGAIPAFECMCDVYLRNVYDDVMKAAREETAMNLEIFTPFTISYEDHLKRLKEYQEQFLEHYDSTPKEIFVRPTICFTFSESKLLCCTSEEEKWIQRAVVKAQNDGLEGHFLSMMNSVAAYVRSVCDCTLEHTPKKVLRMFVTKPCEEGHESLLTFLNERCKEEKEDLFDIIFDENLIYQRDRLKKEVAALEKSKNALRRSVRSTRAL